MAGHSIVVSRTLRYAIIPIIGIASTLGSYALSAQDSSDPVYAATSVELDLAVAEGIRNADAHASSSPPGHIRAAVVPHHLVATEAVALGVKAVATGHPRVVFIISPDHYAKCATLLCTSVGSFETFFGRVAIDGREAHMLLRHTSIVSSSNLFAEEHGVYSIVPFVAHYMPDAAIVPIAVSQRAKESAEDRRQALALIKGLAGEEGAALLVSSDFSHYLPLAEANAEDVKTEHAFCAGDTAQILALDNPAQSDCPLCLWFLEESARANGFWNPAQLWHSNSATLLGDPSVDETTSHYAFALGDTVVPGMCGTAAPTKILFAGDMSFDRYIRQVSEKHGEDFPFSCIDDFLAGMDMIVANLEGPITAHASKSTGSAIGAPENFIFTFPPASAALLARHHIGPVNIGNNHIANFGAEGFAATERYLDAAGVGRFGGLSGDEPIYREQNISFVSYNAFGGQAPAEVGERVRAEKSAGQTVIVYTHWGDEYVDSTEALRPIAKIFADAGADAVIGSHPHVALGHEYIGKTLVYYSLGNFIFDQYWNDQVRKGLAVELTFSPQGITTTEHWLMLEKDGRTCLASP